MSLNPDLLVREADLNDVGNIVECVNDAFLADTFFKKPEYHMRFNVEEVRFKARGVIIVSFWIILSIQNLHFAFFYIGRVIDKQLICQRESLPQRIFYRVTLPFPFYFTGEIHAVGRKQCISRRLQCRKYEWNSWLYVSIMEAIQRDRYWRFQGNPKSQAEVNSFYDNFYKKLLYPTLQPCFFQFHLTILIKCC
jgi:hypothetical protein